MNKTEKPVFVQQDRRFGRKLLRFQKFAFVWGVFALFARSVLRDYDTGVFRAALLDRWQGRFLAFVEDIAQSAASQLEQTRVEFEQKMIDYSSIMIQDEYKHITGIKMDDARSVRNARQRERERAAAKQRKESLRHELIALHEEIFYVVDSCDRLVSARKAEVLSGCASFAEGVCRKEDILLRPDVDLSYDMWAQTFREDAPSMRRLMDRYDKTVIGLEKG